MSLSRHIRLFRPLAVLLALSVAVFSCKEPVKVEPAVPPVLTVKTQTVEGEAGSQFITISATGDWTISTSASWLTVNPSSGSGNNNMVVLSYSENTDAVRTASVTVTGAGGTVSSNVTQKKKDVPVDQESERGYGAKIASARWLELPQTFENDDKEFFTHDMTVGSTKTRNYSFDWDYGNLIAAWVAYPLCTWNIGNGSRSDAWGLDPLLPESKQPVLFNAYSGFGSRGHQIPSADRLARAANVQTFYFTNMTPQDYDFNGGIWANLENQVRTWAKKTGAVAGTDTLYVVTGCYIGKSGKKSYDNKGKAVTVPEGYFKALLRYKNNPEVGHDGFMACAFYFENANKYGTKVSKDLSMSISKLEEKLGYKLFVNLEQKVGSETYKKIKDEDPSTVPWWWN